MTGRPGRRERYSLLYLASRVSVQLEACRELEMDIEREAGLELELEPLNLKLLLLLEFNYFS